MKSVLRLAGLGALSLALGACGEAPGEAEIAQAVQIRASARYERELPAIRDAVGVRSAETVAGGPPELVGLRKRRCREVSMGAGATPPTGYECAVSMRFKGDGWVETTVLAVHLPEGWRIVE